MECNWGTKNIHVGSIIIKSQKILSVGEAEFPKLLPIAGAAVQEAKAIPAATQNLTFNNISCIHHAFLKACINITH
jgi:deoxycytidylate deaminase